MDEATQQAITDAVTAAMNGIDKRLDNLDGRLDGMYSRLNGMDERLDAIAQQVRDGRTEAAASARVGVAVARKLLAPEELAGLNIS